MLESGSLDFTLNEGDIAWLDITLSAVAQDGFDGGRSLIDASHTLEASFTSGDTTLLQAGLPGLPAAVDGTVPEPPAIALTAVGLLGFLLVPRRRRALHRGSNSARCTQPA